MSKPRHVEPTRAEIEAATLALIRFQERRSIKADPEGIARAALVAAAAVRRARRKGGQA